MSSTSYRQKPASLTTILSAHGPWNWIRKRIGNSHQIFLGIGFSAETSYTRILCLMCYKITNLKSVIRKRTLAVWARHFQLWRKSGYWFNNNYFPCKQQASSKTQSHVKGFSKKINELIRRLSAKQWINFDLYKHRVKLVPLKLKRASFLQQII